MFVRNNKPKKKKGLNTQRENQKDKIMNHVHSKKYQTDL